MTSLFNDPVEKRTLQSYLKEARAMVGRWGTPWMRSDEDVITNVANAIARAEIDFDPARGCKRVTLRCTYGRRQIWAEVSKRMTIAKRPTHYSLNVDNDRSEGGSRAFEVADNFEPVLETLIKKERVESMVSQLRKILDRRRVNPPLTRRQKDCLRMRFFDNMSVVKIAKHKKCTKQAVDQLLRHGIKNLQGVLVGV
jgi:DNA-directed RNA polymerase sigma subunit (sigma70/sigma32)